MKFFKKKEKKESGFFKELKLLKRTLFCILDNQITIMMFMQVECRQYRRRETEELAYHFDRRLRDSDGIKDDLRGFKNIPVDELSFDFEGFKQTLKHMDDNNIKL